MCSVHSCHITEENISSTSCQMFSTQMVTYSTIHQFLKMLQLPLLDLVPSNMRKPKCKCRSCITLLLIGRPFSFGFWTQPANFQQFHIIPPIAVYSLEDDVFLIRHRNCVTVQWQRFMSSSRIWQCCWLSDSWCYDISYCCHLQALSVNTNDPSKHLNYMPSGTVSYPKRFECSVPPVVT
jgi:hypothetical protein